MVGALRRAWVAGALALIACGPAVQRARPRVVVIEARAEERPPAPPPLEERVSRARAELDEGELVAERSESLDGEARLHLVLEQGRCYRVWIGAEVPLAVRLEDEHGHVLIEESSEGAWFEEVCPRWSGSFALVVDPGDRGARAAMLVTARER